MRTIIVLAVLVATSLPATAQQRTPGQAAIESAEACVKTKAAAYAVLSDPVSEIAEVALAACAQPIQRLREAAEQTLGDAQAANFMSGMAIQLRSKATVAVADARLAQQRQGNAQ